ncbi:hypothetical protein TNCT_703591 [Trichonephila clavata]|uniref:Uncharacterized protein n=1 Tax=Trichonephila clavata TaxID=2740835 RepID=A0A8X6F0U1_TRICU|nr:hypothetical protein TNCT_703591 [Trichonephila clavata]
MNEINEGEVLKFVESQIDSVLESRYRILLLPSVAERVRTSDLPGYRVLTSSQGIRIRNLLEDKNHELICRST